VTLLSNISVVRQREGEKEREKKEQRTKKKNMRK
jgi:hypothetical protein